MAKAAKFDHKYDTLEKALAGFRLNRLWGRRLRIYGVLVIVLGLASFTWFNPVSGFFASFGFLPTWLIGLLDLAPMMIGLVLVMGPVVAGFVLSRRTAKFLRVIALLQGDEWVLPHSEMTSANTAARRGMTGSGIAIGCMSIPAGLLLAMIIAGIVNIFTGL